MLFLKHQEEEYFSSYRPYKIDQAQLGVDSKCTALSYLIFMILYVEPIYALLLPLKILSYKLALKVLGAPHSSMKTS